MDFNNEKFLVQIHDLGLEKFSRENDRKIENKIGKCMEVEQNVKTIRRMKGEMNVNDPLMVGF